MTIVEARRLRLDDSCLAYRAQPVKVDALPLMEGDVGWARYIRKHPRSSQVTIRRNPPTAASKSISPYQYYCSILKAIYLLNPPRRLWASPPLKVSCLSASCDIAFMCAKSVFAPFNRFRLYAAGICRLLRRYGSYPFLFHESAWGVSGRGDILRCTGSKFPTQPVFSTMH